jgi:hypothetical protein
LFYLELGHLRNTVAADYIAGSTVKDRLICWQRGARLTLNADFELSASILYLLIWKIKTMQQVLQDIFQIQPITILKQSRHIPAWQLHYIKINYPCKKGNKSTNISHYSSPLTF